ncbi:hypothetical protein BC830DRAFT_1164067 [Chytriomyces sp. MP71]|nr:hypothetical protein BC830DRAFT_1164067 [Chytriomyces sp. MP71]
MFATPDEVWKGKARSRSVHLLLVLLAWLSLAAFFFKNGLKGKDIFDTKLADERGWPNFPTHMHDPALFVASKKVVAYSLYGNNSRYLPGAVANAASVPIIYPGWVARFYVDNTVPEAWIHELQALNAEVIEAPIFQGVYWNYARTLWRYLCLSDPEVDYCMARDSDSFITLREVTAVNEWLYKTNKTFHGMRDHPHHEFEVMAGMCGFHARVVRQKLDVAASITHYVNQRELAGTVGWAIDQDWLRDVMFAAEVDDMISHDSYFCQKPLYEPSTIVPFPLPRSWTGEHVGQVVGVAYEAGSLYFDNSKKHVLQEAPEECRKKSEYLFG